MDTDSSKACYQKSLQLLARRDHSCAELKRKLQSRGYGSSEIEAAIRECLRLNYLDDARFAEAYSKQLQRKGFGLNSIRHKLYTKGVPKPLIKEALVPCGTDAVQLEQCRRVLAKKLRPHTAASTISDQGPKLHRFLTNRGFPSHIIRQTIAEAMVRKDTAID